MGIWWIFLVCIVLVSILVDGIQGIFHDLRTWAGILWSLGILLSGSLLGFLFGIPKLLQYGILYPRWASPSGQAVPAGAHTDANQWHDLRVNTNLEQISDWLTKIIVGLVFIHLYWLPSTIDRVATYIAESLGGEQQQFLAVGMMLYFFTLGFLGFYLITRTYFTKLFTLARLGALQGPAMPSELIKPPGLPRT